jgi:hypothetical protein
MPLNPSLQPGQHRPMYLWAGSGTIRMNRLKFMQAPIDEQVHLEGHTAAGARRVIEETACNWVYLTYNWGFPPEQEVEDWDSFTNAAAIYQAAGAKVFAYIQTSNCVYEGSFKYQDWYALDHKGRRIHYYTGRYMTCWQHPGWISHLKKMISGAIQRGTDGIFFDNPWYAAQPVSMHGVWHGSAGCYCLRCQERYLQETGQPIPPHIEPGNPLTDSYIRWRANQVTLAIAHLSNYAKEQSPEILISANNFDAVMRPSHLIYGIDLKSMASVQDIIMIEDYGLPRFQSSPYHRLANNALTIRTARALANDTPISVDPYDQGIGFDTVFPTRRFHQGIAEAAACGASMVVKGTEFVHQGTFTLLTAPQFYETRREIGRYHEWMDEHIHLLEERQNTAPVAILYPGDRIWQAWERTAPLFFGAGQTLLAAGIPWKVVTESSSLEGVQVLIIPDEVGPDGISTSSPVPVITLSRIPGWEPQKAGFSSKLFAKATGAVIDAGYRTYFSSPFARKWMDRAGVMRLFTGTPLFNLPGRSQQAALLAVLPAGLFPRVHAKYPVLIEAWERSGIEEFHLVNYGSQSQNIRIDFGFPRSLQMLSPDSGPKLLESASSLELNVDVYTILTARPFDNHS